MNSPTLASQATTPVTPNPSASPSPAAGTGSLTEIKAAAKDQASQTASDLKQGAEETFKAAKEAGAGFLFEQKSKLADKIDEYSHAVKAASGSLN